MAYPQFFRVRQTFPRPRVADVPGEVERQLASLQLQTRVKPGQSVAITAGSRGIANIHIITKAVVDHFKRLGAQPFIVPSMGSHGGGTAEGQRAILERLRHDRAVPRLPDPLVDGNRSSAKPRKASRSTSTSSPTRPTT